LCYARAHGFTNADGSEALKGWLLEVHARAVRWGELQRPAAPRSTPAAEPPPLYDAELHAQMKADIARLCGPAAPSGRGQTTTRGPRRRRVPSVLMAEELALERDPADLARMRARKAMLHAQAALLQASTPCLEVAGAAD
jgi:hypothetical protein